MPENTAQLNFKSQVSPARVAEQEAARRPGEILTAHEIALKDAQYDREDALAAARGGGTGGSIDHIDLNGGVNPINTAEPQIPRETSAEAVSTTYGELNKISTEARRVGGLPPDTWKVEIRNWAAKSDNRILGRLLGAEPLKRGEIRDAKFVQRAGEMFESFFDTATWSSKIEMLAELLDKDYIGPEAGARIVGDKQQLVQLFGVFGPANIAEEAYASFAQKHGIESSPQSSQSVASKEEPRAKKESENLNDGTRVLVGGVAHSEQSIAGDPHSLGGDYWLLHSDLNVTAEQIQQRGKLDMIMDTATLGGDSQATAEFAKLFLKYYYDNAQFTNPQDQALSAFKLARQDVGQNRLASTLAYTITTNDGGVYGGGVGNSPAVAVINGTDTVYLCDPTGQSYSETDSDGNKTSPTVLIASENGNLQQSGRHDLGKNGYVVMHTDGLVTNNYGLSAIEQAVKQSKTNPRDDVLAVIVK